MHENIESENHKRMQMVIYGAKSIALGVCMAMRELYPEYSPNCFLVSSLQNNSSVLAGLPVIELEAFSAKLSQKEKSGIHVLIGTPEDTHSEIVNLLEAHGLCNYTCIDSLRETAIMEQYFARKKVFPSIHAMKKGTEATELQVFMARFHKDRKLQNRYRIPRWIYTIQVGAELSKEQIAKYTDNVGENISIKNDKYCELTALYWIWKNRLPINDGTTYYGLFHYRRFLDVGEEDIFRMEENNVDVVLPYPTIHEPDITEHHARYVKEENWRAMRQALRELQPTYDKEFDEIFAQPYLYNYNILIAKREVLQAYCDWLFPVLERTENLCVSKGNECEDRYIGYLGESLLTLYFMHHRDDLKIVHTGRIMLT